MQKTHTKTQKTQRSFFLQNRKNTEMKKFAYCVVTFVPIKILTCWTPHNDHLSLSFVKYIDKVSEKMARCGPKTATNE